MNACALAPTLPGFGVRPTEMAALHPSIAEDLHGRYEILECIGEGGMGMVFRARHTSLHRDFALKVLRPELTLDPMVLERLRREALSTARANSPHVVKVNDFGRLSDGAAYIVMELLDGRELATEIEGSGPFSWDRARNIALQICDALSGVHKQGIVHRDLKPENIFLIDSDDFVKVLDFGLAKIRGAASITLAGIAIGTPQYMSPEQCLGEATDLRTDIYSLGMMLYQMLAGRLPFGDIEFPAILAAQVGETPDPIQMHAPELSDEIAALVMRCIDKDPDWRFSSVDELAEAIDGIDVDGLVPTRSGTRPIPESRRPRTETEHPAPSPAPEPPANMLQIAVGAAIFIAQLTIVAAVVLAFLTRPRPSVSTATNIASEPATHDREVLVTSDPAGARVEVDGRLRGRTPVSISPPDGANPYRVRLTLEGHVPREVMLGDGSSDRIRLYLSAEL